MLQITRLSQDWQLPPKARLQSTWQVEVALLRVYPLAHCAQVPGDLQLVHLLSQVGTHVPLLVSVYPNTQLEQLEPEQVEQKLIVHCAATQLGAMKPAWQR